MERAIKPQNNFSRNIAEAKSKLRGEHHRLSHRRIGKSFFSAPAHEWQISSRNNDLEIKAKRRGIVVDSQTARLELLHLIICGGELNCIQRRRPSNMCRKI